MLDCYVNDFFSARIFPLFLSSNLSNLSHSLVLFCFLLQTVFFGIWFNAIFHKNFAEKLCKTRTFLPFNLVPILFFKFSVFHTFLSNLSRDYVFLFQNFSLRNCFSILSLFLPLSLTIPFPLILHTSWDGGSIKEPRRVWWRGKQKKKFTDEGQARNDACFNFPLLSLSTLPSFSFLHFLFQLFDSFFCFITWPVWTGNRRVFQAKRERERERRKERQQEELSFKKPLFWYSPGSSMVGWRELKCIFQAGNGFKITILNCNSMIEKSILCWFLLSCLFPLFSWSQVCIFLSYHEPFSCLFFPFKRSNPSPIQN